MRRFRFTESALRTIRMIVVVFLTQGEETFGGRGAPEHLLGPLLTIVRRPVKRFHRTAAPAKA